MDILLIDIALTLVCEHLVNGNTQLTARNSEDDITWITMKGNHIPIKKGETKEEAIKKFISSKEKTSSSEKTQSKEFKKWFGKSKAVDKKGNPLVFYHGTPNGGFSEFYEDSYFTTNLDLAQDYQDPDASGLMYKDTAEKPQVYSVYLSLQNPFDTRDEKAKRIFTEEYEEYLQAGITSKGLPETGEAQYLLEFLKEEYPEYDSIIVDMGTGGNNITGWEDRGEAYIVFNPNQIKSTDNKGNFNPESNNIYE